MIEKNVDENNCETIKHLGCPAEPPDTTCANDETIKAENLKFHRLKMKELRTRRQNALNRKPCPECRKAWPEELYSYFAN